ncbi:GCN5 family acetyltransferase [Brevundimonas sp. GW460-12-10-14-LB2]|uniref:GNAT family N-acetyltransferase n=1 Tax=Brevundimonas sp. GW460-12-10-14-LB2 TaxID=1827469 RepID=UPI0007BCCBDB|nr:GNAT family N-acetyltransferase [Brevundimonas sp. GW460-12-10-14-LB2]ANC52493.1 GCN5 family acetyltransferase [Brevundimonas sp. GW460-12-10-14-LB2]MEA3472596.1 GNAT family N-acetyltransferase [Pseudomonadota bacterium]
MTQIAIRAATSDDVAALHPLIERAYRGDTAKAGWTHEADLLFDDRTSAAELASLIADPDRVILLAHRDGALIGCVQVARAGDDLAYLGMVTVEPTLQARGLGRRLLAAAESEAVARFGARRMEMTVIHRRAELIAWYERRGYAPTGETRPFPVDPPRPELDFVVLEKAL